MMKIVASTTKQTDTHTHSDKQLALSLSFLYLYGDKIITTDITEEKMVLQTNCNPKH